VELPTIDPDNDLPIVRPPRPPITPENELPEVDLPTIEPDNDLPIVRPSRPPITPENELPEVELPTIDPDNELPIVRPPRPPITPENKLPEVELPILAPDSELPTVNPDDIPPIDPIRPPNPPTEIDNETADDSEKPWWNNQDNAHLRPGHPDYVDNNVDKPITTPAPPIATVPPRTPTAALHDISTVTWAEDDATSHNIYVDNNLVESDYTGSSYDLRNLSLNPGLHEIQVSASNNAGQESEPSDSINYVVWHFE
ncbi:MAG: hypothetical protein FWG64_01000, partial [Firmicutes bacterium]|nr:hypothetical protein [Bacillota bacterium]